MHEVELTVKTRDSFGSAKSNRMRKSGWIPGVLYGDGSAALSLAVEEKTLRRALGHESSSAILAVKFEGEKEIHQAILKEYQVDPVSSSLLHVDLMEVQMNKPVEATVRLELVGSAAGVLEGGVLSQSLREVSVRCLPTDIPEVVEFNVETMKIGDTVHVSDLLPPANVEIMDEPGMVVVNLLAPRLKTAGAGEAAESTETATE